MFIMPAGLALVFGVATYDLCADCSDVVDYWGTPEILIDFGFVEGFPHRWAFPDDEVWFEVWKGADDKLQVYFDTDEFPNSIGISLD